MASAANRNDGKVEASAPTEEEDDDEDEDEEEEEEEDEEEDDEKGFVLAAIVVEAACGSLLDLTISLAGVTDGATARRWEKFSGMGVFFPRVDNPGVFVAEVWF